MVNKLGLLSGVLLALLNFFAVIPLGIYLSGGISSYTGIPLYYFNYNNIQVYAWGIVDNLNPSNWFETGANGIFSFILIHLLLICSLILCLLGSYARSGRGKKALLISFVMALMVFVFMFVDVAFLGTYVIGEIIPVDQLLGGTIGMGFYILVTVLILQILAVKYHIETPKEE